MIFDDYALIKKAYSDTSKGKREQGNHIKYSYFLEPNLYNLQHRLQNNLYHPAHLREKKINYPKKRVAQVPSVEDKIVQHLICDNYAYERLTKPLIKETSACIKGRGSDHARNLLKEQLHHFYRTHHKMPYILKMDIHSYFASIEHKGLIKLIERYIEDEQIKFVLYSFLDLTEIGLPLGLQQSQLLANLNLSEMDHMFKEKYRVDEYGRYMDDFYILSADLSFLLMLKEDIEKYLNGRGLELNPKSAITYNKIEYLGFTYKLTDTGKVICKLANGKKITQRHRLKLLAEELAVEKKSIEYVAASYQGWRNHASKGNTRNVLLAMDKMFDDALSKYGFRLDVIVVGGKEKVKIWQEQ